jgi:hypothetical protein
VLVTQTGARQDDGRQRRILQVNRQPGWNQLGLTRRQCQVIGNTGTQVQPGGFRPCCF